MISFEITFLVFIPNRAATRDLPWFVFCSAKETSDVSFFWIDVLTDWRKPAIITGVFSFHENQKSYGLFSRKEEKIS